VTSNYSFPTFVSQQRKANLHSLSIDAGPGANHASYSIGIKGILLPRVEQQGPKLTYKSIVNPDVKNESTYSPIATRAIIACAGSTSPLLTEYVDHRARGHRGH
jgi:hypothetical protein